MNFQLKGRPGPAKFIIMLFSVLLFTYCDSGHIGSAADMKEVIVETDRAFSELSVKEGRAAAFTAYADDEAVMYRDKAEPLMGKKSIVELMNRSGPGTLEWEPFKAEVAASGDLGYTLGKWTFSAPDSAGNETKSHGYYCSIWKKQQDGSWKWVYDGGVQGPGNDK